MTSVSVLKSNFHALISSNCLSTFSLFNNKSSTHSNGRELIVHLLRLCSDAVSPETFPPVSPPSPFRRWHHGHFHFIISPKNGSAVNIPWKLLVKEWCRCRPVIVWQRRTEMGNTAAFVKLLSSPSSSDVDKAGSDRLGLSFLKRSPGSAYYPFSPSL